MNPESESRQDLGRGFFVIGLLGELEDEGLTDDETIETKSTGGNPSHLDSWNGRVVIRTLHVERATRSSIIGGNSNSQDSISAPYFDRLRVVVYCQPPFIFTMLFETETYSLALPSCYRSLHHQLGPLRKPLQTITSPRRVRERLKGAIIPRSTAPAPSTQPIDNLVYDPARLATHATIPSIPDGTSPPSDASSSPWSRAEAITVHSQILESYASTRGRPSELERTCKTSRGWWVVWMRLPPALPAAPSSQSSHSPRNDTPGEYREAFLIRKASDYAPPAARAVSMSARWRGSPSSGGALSAGAGRLADGIGIDARQYVESLLSLTR